MSAPGWHEVLCTCGLVVNVNGVGWLQHLPEHTARMEKQEPSTEKGQAA